MKKAAKLFATRFAASSSLVGDDEIQIQGDHSMDLVDLIPKTFPQARARARSRARGSP